MYLVQYEDLPFFFSWGWWRGGGSGGLTFNILASYPGQEVEIFLVKECYRNMDFFSARYAVRLVCRLDDIYVTVFFIFKSFIGVCASNTVFDSRQVGMYDGTIAIYNVRSRSDTPALDSL